MSVAEVEIVVSVAEVEIAVSVLELSVKGAREMNRWSTELC